MTCVNSSSGSHTLRIEDRRWKMVLRSSIFDPHPLPTPVVSLSTHVLLSGEIEAHAETTKDPFRCPARRDAPATGAVSCAYAPARPRRVRRSGADRRRGAAAAARDRWRYIVLDHSVGAAWQRQDHAGADYRRDHQRAL